MKRVIRKQPDFVPRLFLLLEWERIKCRDELITNQDRQRFMLGLDQSVVSLVIGIIFFLPYIPKSSMIFDNQPGICGTHSHCEGNPEYRRQLIHHPQFNRRRIDGYNEWAA